MLIVSLVIYKQRKDRNSPKAGLLDDIDDETGNIMVYSNEGGGEEDQVNYKLISPLIYINISSQFIYLDKL